MIRRSFLSNLMLSSMGFLGLSKVKASQINSTSLPRTKLTGTPFSSCTWNCPEAITTSGDLMMSGTDSLDAVIKGVAVEEVKVDNYDCRNWSDSRPGRAPNPRRLCNE